MSVSSNVPTSPVKSKVTTGGNRLDVQALTKRLQSELMGLMMNKPHGVSAFPENENLYSWVATINGTEGTPYEGLSFKLSLKFPNTYPYSPPTVKFDTPCFHPNVDQHGYICLDILKEQWSAVYSVSQVLISIQSLLGEPNNESPLNTHAASLWPNTAEFCKVARQKYREQVGTD
eukprot:TRINITY_DN67510_c5_g4_i1.p1 TRINITY_DN67510_c5_g4~~TRINITY_DN67510_c5_g4_i1.p1  ORF type:complete len:175 (-),score=13.50 TRINITY_DN67510_c5_g4_i1:68-592(-)